MSSTTSTSHATTGSLTRFLREFARDLRLATRGIRRAPGFAIVATLTIALGIGANAAIFSVINAILLRPFAYREADRLVRVYESLVDQPLWQGSVSVPNLRDWQAQAKGIDSFIGYRTGGRILGGQGEPERVRVVETTASVFPTLGMQMLAGRGFGAETEKAGANYVVVLTESFWRRRYGSDRSIVGQTIVIDGDAHVVTGVAASRYDFPPGGFAPDLYIPFSPTEGDAAQRGNHFLSVVGHIAPGATFSTAQREMRDLARRLERDWPKEMANRTVLLVPLQESVSGGVRTPLLVLLGAVALLLLIACANVANLQLARATVREQELGVRLALGATRAQLMRGLLAESLVIAAGGAIFGAVIAWGGLRLVQPLLESALPSHEPVGVDATAFVFLLVVSLASGLAFGLAPAIRVTGNRLRDAVINASRRSTSGGGQQRFRSALVVAQIALSLMLLAGAGLLLRAFAAVRGAPPGMETENVLTARVRIPAKEFTSGKVADRLYQPLLDGVRALPGVKSAGMINMLPIDSWGWNSSYWIDGEVRPPAGKEPLVEVRSVSPGYFASMSIPLIEGRLLTEQDNETGNAPVLVNRAFVHKHFAGRSALGNHIRMGDGASDIFEIVGVVGDVRQAGLDQPAIPEMYYPYRAFDGGSYGTTLVVKSTTDPLTLTNALRDVVKRTASQLALADTRTMDEVIERSLSSRRLSVTLLGTFAALALLLATTGLYGVIAYLVAQRSREIGIRVALGSDRGRVLRLVLGQGGRLAAVGIALGIAGGLALSGVLRSMLFGVSAHDPLTFALVAILLALVTIIAALVPAWRAARTDPMVALRSE